MRSKWMFLGWPLLVGPWLFTYIGAALNEFAIAANQGTMPVLLKNCAAAIPDDDDVHVCMTTATHLKFICDWVTLHTAVLSPGDVLLNIGDVLSDPCYWAWVCLAVIALYKVHRPSIQP